MLCLIVMGTRPEAIKMAPLVHACKQRAGAVEPIVCLTGQHREMLAQVTDYFDIQPAVNLNLMRPNQSLAGLTSRCLEELDRTIQQYRPDFVVAQGDTTTVFSAALAAFYRHTPFVHVEAGLRTGNLLSPWPEEFNRRIPGIVAHLHCAPTTQAAQNLFAEDIDPRRVKVTGNTVIDALLWTAERERQHDQVWCDKYKMLADRRVVLVTGHRRENFGHRFESVCRAIADLAATFPQTEFIYPVHLNPQVRGPALQLLGGKANIHLTDPAPYPEFVWLMNRADLILTDSGGVQEEAPSLRKPVLVTRDTTERPEAVQAGAVKLVGTDHDILGRAATRLLTDPDAYAECQVDDNPYGDGRAAERIVNWMLTEHASSPRAADIASKPAA